MKAIMKYFGKLVISVIGLLVIMTVYSNYIVGLM